MTRTRLVKSTGVTTTAQIAYQTGPFTIGQYESMQDVVTPRFSEKSAKGEVIVNSMSKYSWNLTMTPGGFSFENAGTGPNNFIDTYDGYYAIDRKNGPSGHLPVSIDVQGLLTQASTQAASNVRAPIFDGLVFVAELNETMRFLRNPIGGWVRFLEYAKRQKRRNSRLDGTKVIDFISSNWLAYRYAVRPLVFDTINLIDAVNKTIEGQEPKRFTARGTASDAGSESYTGLSSSYAANVRLNTSTSRNVSVRAGILYESKAGADNFGTSLYRIPVALWEVVPFSFVVDWFINIGDYVGAISPKVGVKVLGSWTGVKDTQTSNTTSHVESLDDTGDTILNPGHCQESFVTETKNRSKGITVGITGTSAARSLGKLDTVKLIDLFAIAHQLLSSK
jgi:hypothetical protein